MYLDWGEPYATYKHLGNEACCMYVLVDIIRVMVNALFCTPPRGLHTRISSEIQVQIACCVFRYLAVCKLSADFRSWRLLSRRLKAMYVEVLYITHTCLLLKMIHMTQSPLTHLIRHMLFVTTYSRCTKPIHVY